MITALIVNYYDHLLTARAAASVLADQPDAQVIVVDNSNDEQAAASLQAVVPPQVTCLTAHENLGFGRGCNLGFEHARHEWVLLLNPDAIVLRGCIEALVSFLRDTPQAGAVAPLTYWDREQSWLLPPAQLSTPSAELAMALAVRFPWLGKRISLAFRSWALRCITADGPVRQRMLSGGHMLIRRSALEKVGGLFDPDFFMYFEDTDLCQRLQKAGYSLYLLPSAKAVHEWQSSHVKNDLCSDSRLRYLDKHYSRHAARTALECLERSGLPLRLPPTHPLGHCSVPPVIALAAGFPSEWVLELSPQPLLVPALYHSGTGQELTIPDRIWQRLGPGHYVARVADRAGRQSCCFSWEK